MTSHVRIGAETILLLRESAALGKFGFDVEVSLGTKRSQTLTGVPETAAGRSRAKWRHGDIA
jgi:hypothetical protein